MGADQYYKLHGYLELLIVDVGFVTPVFYRNKQLYIEISLHNRITNFVSLPECYEQILKIDLGKTDYEVKIGSQCIYAFKYLKSIYYGDSNVLIDILKKLLKAKIFPYNSEVLARKFVKRYDEFNSEKIQVMIVDDHKLIRDTWTFLLNKEKRYEVIAEAAEGGEAVKIAGVKKPSIVLMDIKMRPVSGFDATKGIKKKSPGSKIIGVSMHSQPDYAKKMFRLGARGYLSKNSGVEEMFSAIDIVYNGGLYVCEDVKNRLAEMKMEEEAIKGNKGLLSSTLSEREMEIVKLIKEGLSSKEIATRLNTSLKAIEVLRHNILTKLKLKHNASLMTYIKSGI
ncbi:MAG TPA: response regulator transcription factor [Mucilaginibacter sp.]|jgi:DNA-binding NarL/FixJ family response regulator